MKKIVWIGVSIILIIGCCFVGTKMFGDKKPVTENQNQKGREQLQEEKKVPRMVKVNGTLYYDTGKLSMVEGRCGMADGYIHTTVFPNETPIRENESNFGSQYGFQYESENTIAVILPTGWTVFSSNIEEADMDVSKNYVTIKDGQIDNNQLVEHFVQRVNQNYEGELTFYDEDNNQFYYLKRVRFDRVGEPYTNVEHGYEYQLYVDTMKANENPRYQFYQFATLDISNGLVLKDSGRYILYNFTDEVVQKNAEEFVIY